MIANFNKLAGVALLLCLTGCNKAAYLNMGKEDDIAETAEKYIGSTDWARDGSKYPNDDKEKKFFYPKGSWKCNLFVNDVLYDSGIEPPKTNGGWPITASMWTRSVAGWGTVSSQQRGDVVSDGSHCGIAISSARTVAAGENRVYEGSDISGTIQRHNES